ncbi:MotA/TolQ/ExbB proton channel family protein [soil metagenome]
MSFFQSGALGLLLKGGIFMWPILVLGIAGAAVTIERYRSLRMLGTDAEDLKRSVVDDLTSDRLEEALNRCESARGPVPAILSIGLRKFLVLRRLGYAPDRIEAQVIKSMEQSGAHVVAALERHLPVLATVSSVAPMLGFLGTVQGMIVAFARIVETMGEVNIVEAAAAGIQTALLTTCFGLVVGIPAYLAYNYFTGVINSFILEVETSAAELIETVTLQMALSEPDQNRP